MSLNKKNVFAFNLHLWIMCAGNPVILLFVICLRNFISVKQLQTTFKGALHWFEKNLYLLHLKPMDKKSKKDTVTLEKEGKRKKEEDVKQDQKENEVATNNKLEKPEQ